MPSACSASATAAWCAARSQPCGGLVIAGPVFNSTACSRAPIMSPIKGRRAGRVRSVVDGRRRVIVAAVRPEIDGGRFPVKRVVGDVLDVEADLLVDGHDILAARVLYRHDDGRRVERAGARSARQRPLARRVPADRRSAAGTTPSSRGSTSSPASSGASERKLDAQQRRQRRAPRRRRAVARGRRARARATPTTRACSPSAPSAAVSSDALALDPALSAAMARHPDRRFATRLSRVLEVVVDPRARALLGLVRAVPALDAARTASTAPSRRREAGSTTSPSSASTSSTCRRSIRSAARIARAATTRSTAGARRRRQPVGDRRRRRAATQAVHPELGTLADFDHFVARGARARARGRARHRVPGVARSSVGARASRVVHAARPTASIQYAENPPKKYQDVYPFDFESADWRALWDGAARRVPVLVRAAASACSASTIRTPSRCRSGSGASREVKAQLSRRDLPRRGVHAAEADVRARPRRVLAVVHVLHVAHDEVGARRVSAPSSRSRRCATSSGRTSGRTTPDILPEHLSARRPRRRSCSALILAATLSSSYGIYGPSYELMEHDAAARRRGVRDNEKYQLRTWDLDARRFAAPRDRAASTASAASNPALARHALAALSHDRQRSRDLLLQARRTTASCSSSSTSIRHHAHRALARRSTSPRSASHADETFQVHDLPRRARAIAGAAAELRRARPAHQMPAHIFARPRASRAASNRLRVLPMTATEAARALPTIRSGTRTRSSTRSTSARSATRTTTASATSTA